MTLGLGGTERVSRLRQTSAYRERHTSTSCTYKNGLHAITWGDSSVRVFDGILPLPPVDQKGDTHIPLLSLAGIPLRAGYG